MYYTLSYLSTAIGAGGSCQDGDSCVDGAYCKDDTCQCRENYVTDEGQCRESKYEKPEVPLLTVKLVFKGPIKRKDKKVFLFPDNLIFCPYTFKTFTPTFSISSILLYVEVLITMSISIVWLNLFFTNNEKNLKICMTA